MPWCPVCKIEFEAGRTVCTECGAALVSSLGDVPDPEGFAIDGSGLPQNADADAPVVVLHANTANEARIAEATLEAEGISAFVQPPDTVMPQYSNTVDDDNPELDVLVAADEAAEAAEILNAPAVSEEELAEAAEADLSGANTEGKV
jgi:hypothetical protein